MPPFPDDLETQIARVAPADGNVLFDSAWKIVQECGQAERHFNQLQSVYRGLASTWLLATLGAVGYLLFNKDTRGQHYEWIAAIVAAMGAVGIVLLWILDLVVYHRLLLAVFNEGKRLEDKFPWLPRFRTNMSRGKEGARDPVMKKLAGYYVGTTAAPMLAAGVLLQSAVRGYGYCWTDFLVAGAVTALVVGLLFFWTSKRPAF